MIGTERQGSSSSDTKAGSPSPAARSKEPKTSRADTGRCSIRGVSPLGDTQNNGTRLPASLTFEKWYCQPCSPKLSPWSDMKTTRLSCSSRIS